MNPNDTRSRLFRISNAIGNISRNGGAKRRRRLLAEFLQEISARQQPNAEEEASSQDSEIEVQDHQVTLSDDLLFKILILLPADSLSSSRFVCKQWFGLINSSVFTRCHAQQSNTVLICKKLTFLEPGNSAALVRPQGFEADSKGYFHFMDLDHGGHSFMESSVVELGDIVASCDGLILATTKKSKSVVLMNPVTRKHIVLPLSRERDFFVESFGIAFCNEAKTYKIVHLFGEESGCSGCGILNICARKWTRIEGPPVELLRDIRRIPVIVGGNLYWMPTKRGCDCFLSMNFQDEKFTCKSFPVSRGAWDWLLEIGGCLGFVTHAQFGELQVWVLITGQGSRENWIQKYSIDLSAHVKFASPVCCLKNGGRMVLEMKNELHAYDFETGEMKLIRSRLGEVRFGRINKQYIPHRNTLVSWEDNPKVLC